MQVLPQSADLTEAATLPIRLNFGASPKNIVGSCRMVNGVLHFRLEDKFAMSRDDLYRVFGCAEIRFTSALPNGLVTAGRISSFNVLTSERRDRRRAKAEADDYG